MEDLKAWAVVEKEYIRKELESLKGGGKVLSPSGDDITREKMSELEYRLEHVRKVLGNP